MSGKRSTKHSLTSSNNDDNLCYHSTTVWRVLLDVFSLSVLLIITVISHFILKPFTRGYFCTDYSIHYPYKSNTVSTTADVLLSTLLPLLWIWLTEFIKLFYYRWYPQTIYYTKLQLCGVRIRNIHPFIRNLYLLTVVFLYGYLTTWVLTEIAKNFVGELRPHFFELCRPNVTCSCSSSCGVNNQVYITNYVCLNTDETAVREGR
ncbi:unnamed protein product [Didymodactylos carnosus]|nr:unnamed protein product [Didymodactylos carnosus]CAF4133338.1 unnamed protein product [Didymodactylos carnosus]